MHPVVREGAGRHGAPPPSAPRTSRRSSTGSTRSTGTTRGGQAKLVERQGWPTRSQVGEQAAVSAWLLAQHADQDPALQRRCLDLMRAFADGSRRRTPRT